jgi:hypothetical protein
MTKTELLDSQRIRHEYAKQIQAKIKNRREAVPLPILEDLCNSFPEEMQTLLPQTEHTRLNLDPTRRHALRLALSESKYRAETVTVHGRPYPVRIFQHRYTTEQLVLNWTQSYRITLPNKRPMTLDIFYGAKNAIPLKGRFVSHQGLQASERVVDASDHAIPEQNILKLKPIGQSGYYALANRNFFEDRSLPSGLHLQRFILGQNTRQSILRTACYLAKLADYNDWRVTETIYRSILQTWLCSFKDTNQTNGFQGIGLSTYSLDRLSTDQTRNLDRNPEYPKLIKSLTELPVLENTLEHLNHCWSLGDGKHGLKVVITPNLIGPFHIHRQAVSLQSKETHTQAEHQHNIREAVRSILQTKELTPA